MPRQPSSLVQQLSEKVRTQAERLQRMEVYKQLCEKRIQDLFPSHELPVLPHHIGQQTSEVELRKQLALKE